MALRPGGSPSPDPVQQQQYQNRTPAPTYGGGQPMNRPSSNNQAPPTNFSTRFSSNNYGQSPVEAGSGQSPISPAPNAFADHSRSHSAATGHQSYPSGSDHQYPPPQAQAIQPQHSGYNAPTTAIAPAGNSRPVSRSANPNSSRPTTAKSPFSTPISAPPRPHPSQILLINPNSTRSMTENMLTAVRPSLPPHIELTGYTAPYPAPLAIESLTDAVMSTETCLRDLAKYSSANGETIQNYDGMIVACYSAHPLIDALRESYDVPVVGIMEASLYVARMLGGRFGIVATSTRSRFRQEDAVEAYGLSHFYVGSEATNLGVLELDGNGGQGRNEVSKRVAHAARVLAARGADTILLGCAGMTEVVRAAKDGVREEDGRRTVNVIDGVEAGVMMMASLVGMGVPTSKRGIYKGEREGRRLRGQNWL